jgi:aminobenzoyl-glutamate utilization protein B
MKKLLLLCLGYCFVLNATAQQKMDDKALQTMKTSLNASMDKYAKDIQVMVDQIFSYSELGFQEWETSKFIISVLEKNGFTVEKGISGVPTAWMAKWGNGSPVIALGSDIDCIPKASQKPGVAFRAPIVDGAPGHGEGHNSGQAVIIYAAIAMKEMMEKQKIPGTLMIWPGVAEELVGTKAWYIRDGYFKNVDACVRFDFEGDAAHAAGAPWRGKSALDAVELMNVGWNYKREHLKPTNRSHYVVVDGGDQPNVVPSKASVWYYFRERTYEDIKANYESGIQIAKGAAMMTNTNVSYQILGTAWPGHFNKPLAEAMYANIKKVGMPVWDDKDQTMARAVQQLVEAPKKDNQGKPIDGLRTKPDSIKGSVAFSWGGGSDDIADISWNIPTVVLRFPANIPGTKGHHWADAIAMATPIAHKGSLAGAKATAMTLLDCFTNPTVITEAKKYFKEVQTKDVQYKPFITEKDPPAIHLNKGIMDQYKDQLKKYHYDPSKYGTYLEQLGITYPTINK